MRGPLHGCETKLLFSRSITAYYMLKTIFDNGRTDLRFETCLPSIGRNRWLVGLTPKCLVSEEVQFGALVEESICQINDNMPLLLVEAI